jgi:hypothetical protein
VFFAANATVSSILFFACRLLFYIVYSPNDALLWLKIPLFPFFTSFAKAQAIPAPLQKILQPQS